MSRNSTERTDHDCNEHWHIMSSGRACRGRAKDYFAECEICGRTEAPEEVNHTLAYLHTRIAVLEEMAETAWNVIRERTDSPCT